MYSSRLDRCLADGEALLADSRDALVGEVLDRYRLMSVIGKGAMGCVYRARHTILPREYAVKVLFRELLANPSQVERFQREALAASAIAHPNVVSVIDFVTLPSGVSFLVMELVAGRTLEHAIALEAPFAPERAAQIARQIAAGLMGAHASGFVHRDVKPGNVMVSTTREGEQVKILDFGIVSSMSTLTSSRLTAIGTVMGTPTYMAPEQLREGKVGPASDLYALGVILFEMLSGQPPFVGDDPTDVLTKHLTMAPPPLPPSSGLEAVAMWLLEKDFERRPKSAQEVLAALEQMTFEGSGQDVSFPENDEETVPPSMGMAPLEDGDSDAPEPSSDEPGANTLGVETFDPTRTRVTRTREIRLGSFREGTARVLETSFDSTQVGSSRSFGADDDADRSGDLGEGRDPSIAGDGPTRVDVFLKQWSDVTKTPLPVVIDDSRTVATAPSPSARVYPLGSREGDGLETQVVRRQALDVAPLQEHEALGKFDDRSSDRLVAPVISPGDTDAYRGFPEAVTSMDVPATRREDTGTAPLAPATLLKVPGVRSSTRGPRVLPGGDEWRLYVAVGFGVVIGALLATLVWFIAGRSH